MGTRFTSAEVAVLGKLFCDLVFTDLPFYPQLGQEAYSGGFGLSLGGSAPHVAVGLSRLGCKVALVSAAGEDYFGGWALSQLRQDGVDTGLTRAVPMTQTNLTVAVSHKGERAMVTHLGGDSLLPVEQVDWDALAAVRLLHVAGFFGVEKQRSLFEKARSKGMALSWDVGWMAVVEHPREIREILPLVDIFAPNEAEAMALTGAANGRAAVEELGRWVCTPIVKLGERGAVAFDRDRARIIQGDGIRVETIDTTGAGDAFVAGFLFGYLSNQPVERCLLYGNICGAFSTTALGGVAALPTKTELFRMAIKYGEEG